MSSGPVEALKLAIGIMLTSFFIAAGLLLQFSERP